MASFNKVVLVGNVTRDPELKTIGSGSVLSDVGLAVNDRRKDASGQYVDDVSFFDVTVWGRTAEIACEYAKKGTPILVEGRLKQDVWEQDGQKRSKTKIVAERLVLLSGGKGDGGANGGGGFAPNRRANERGAGESAAPAAFGSEADIPF